jgi:uncharacterized membrane protein
MAGIGFRLKNYFNEGGLLGNIQGTIYSIIISSGPWLISVITIALVSTSTQGEVGVDNLYIFKSMICYSFAASLLVFGAIEMPMTRYIADQLYNKDYTTFKGVYLYLATAMIIFGSIVSLIFYSYIDILSVMDKIFAIAFFCSIMIVWLSMIFLSAAKNYHQIIISFMLGGIVSLVGSILLGKTYQLTGYIAGYSIGQILIALLLSLNIFNEFKGIDYSSFEFTRYFKKHSNLIFVGLFYYLGIWVDKFIFWFGSTGKQVTGLFYTNQYYDTSMFLAYLSIVPSLAIFLVQVETNFYKKYLFYFKAIDRKQNLDILNINVQEIIDSVKTGIYNLLKIQIGVTLICWYFADQIMAYLYLPSMMVPMFQYGLLATFLQVLCLIMNIILLYFLSHNKVLLHYFIFFISNMIFTYLITYLDFRYQGLGYLMSTFLVFIVSFQALNKQLKFINFYTFMGQSISEE